MDSKSDRKENTHNPYGGSDMEKIHIIS